MKGMIQPDYYVTCYRCEYGLHIGGYNLTDAARKAREAGWWQITANHQKRWVCVDCKNPPRS